MDLRFGAVAELPFDDVMFDVTVSVNTVQLWPDLTAGLREMSRVTRPGGIVLIAWHGGSAPSRIQRQLLLDDKELDRIASSMNDHVGKVDRQHPRNPNSSPQSSDQPAERHECPVQARLVTVHME